MCMHRQVTTNKMHQLKKKNENPLTTTTQKNSKWDKKFITPFTGYQ